MPTPTLTLTGLDLSIDDVVRVARSPETRIVLSGDALSRLERSRGLVDQAVAAGETIYGINTGFGKLANVRVAAGQLDQLQVNLIRSHAAGVGSPLPIDVVRAAMLLRANVLLRPTSGVRPALVRGAGRAAQRRHRSRVPEQGSVGASGDLAPLSHIAMVLMGEGEVLGGESTAAPTRHSLAPASRRFGSLPRRESASSTAPRPRPRLLALLVHDAEVLWRTAVGAAAMSLEALRGTPTPLDPRIHAARPHPGQLRAAELDAGPAGGERDPGVAPGKRPPGAGCLQPPLHSTGAGRGGRRDSLRAGNRGGSSSTPRPTIRWCSTTARCSRAATSTASRWRRRSISSPSRSPRFRPSPSDGWNGW